MSCVKLVSGIVMINVEGPLIRQGFGIGTPRMEYNHVSHRCIRKRSSCDGLMILLRKSQKYCLFPGNSTSEVFPHWSQTIFVVCYVELNRELHRILI